jgi:hypothetical protein
LVLGVPEEMSDSNPVDTPVNTVAATGPPEIAQKKPRARRTRAIISWVLIVLASLLIPISVISVWAIRTVTNTDQYVSTMAPLARNPVIIDQLANRTTDALFSSHIVQNKVTGLLPAKAKPLVVPITNEVKSYVHGLALKFYESPAFGRLWDLLNRHTHDAVVDILEGRTSPALERLEKGGAIVVNVSPALNTIVDQLNQRGVTLFNPVKAITSEGGKGLGITIVSKQQVDKYSGLFNTIVDLGWAVPIAALVLGVLSIAVAVNRRRALLRVTLGISIVTLVFLAALATGRNFFLNEAASLSLRRDVAGAVWDTLLRYLKTDFRWMLLVALIVAFLAWVFGPARYAVWIRTHVARSARWLGVQGKSLSGGAGRAVAGSESTRHVGGWIEEHLNGLRIVGVAVAAIVLLFSGNLSGWGLLIILIVLLVYLALLQLMALWARKVAPPTATSAVDEPQTVSS